MDELDAEEKLEEIKNSVVSKINENIKFQQQRQLTSI
jgi:hypothetical protein